MPVHVLAFFWPPRAASFFDGIYDMCIMLLMQNQTRSELRRLIEQPGHLRSILTYNPETGALRWISSNQNGRTAGTVNHDGYLKIAIQRIDFKAHRIAWIMHTGRSLDPCQQIDHLNGDKLDNRISNLRPCSAKENQENSRKPKNNTTGFKGVSRCGDRFRAYICHQRKQIHLGVFDAPEAAHEAYVAAAKTLRWPIHRAN